MRGLPFEAGPAEIVRFFEGRPCFVNNLSFRNFLQILFCNFLLSGLAVAEKGVLICKDSNRRPSGEGYCVFVDEEAVAEALKRDNASMGHRLVCAGGLRPCLILIDVSIFPFPLVTAVTATVATCESTVSQL